MVKKDYCLTVYFKAEEEVAKCLGFDRPINEMRGFAKLQLKTASLRQMKDLKQIASLDLTK